MIADHVLDNGVGSNGAGQANALHICSADPSTYSAATTTNSLGSKSSPSMSVVDGTGGGRAAQVGAFTDGNVSATGTATHWALVDTANSRLLATGALSASQAVTNGNTFGFGAFQAVRIPDAA